MKESDKLANRTTRSLPRPPGLEKANPPPLPPPPTFQTVIPVAPHLEHSAEAAEEEFDVRKYWYAVRDRLWLVLGVTGLATLLAALYMARKPDVYEARARVEVNVENAVGVVSNGANGATIYNSPASDPAYFSTQLQILTDAGLLRRVVKTLELEHQPDFFRPQAVQQHSTLDTLFEMVGLSRNRRAKEAKSDDLPLVTAVAPAAPRNDLREVKRLAPYVGAVKANLRVEPVKEPRLTFRETRLIDIYFTHPEPQLAARIVNALVDTFVLANLEKKTGANTSSSDFLQKRIAEVQAQIRDGEERSLNYARNHQDLSLDVTQNPVVERLTGLNRELLAAENARTQAEAAYRAAQEPAASEALAEDATTQIVNAETKLTELRQRRAQLKAEFTDEWPEVQVVNQQITTLEKQLQEIRQRAGTNVAAKLETRYKQALAHEQSLRAAYEKQRSQTLAQNEAAINYRILQQEIQTNKNLLDGLLQRSKENNVMLAGTTNNIHVIDYAIPPGAPIGPQRRQITGLACLLALAAGLGLALFLGYLDDTVRSTDDVEHALHLPVLALIPAQGQALGQRLLGSVMPWRSLPPSNGAQPGQLLLTGAGEEPPRKNKRRARPLVEVNQGANTPLAEAYRQLRTSVLLSSAGGPARTLLITSSLPSEGKTTTAANLALSLAQTKAKVLLIDADLRRPQLHAHFELSNERGLSTLLASELDKNDVYKAIAQYGKSSLYVLPAGPLPPNPAELLGSEPMRRLLNFLEVNYTYVIIDSPPIASFTDGVLLATMVEGVLLVVGSGQSARPLVQRARKLLADVGAKVLGVVLNNVQTPQQQYYAYQGGYQQQDAQ